MKGIPVYKEINEVHEITGSPLRTNNELFHCFNMADANDLKVNSLPPYRTGFFSLSLSFGSEKFRMTVNDVVFNDLGRFIICIAPDQISDFQKDGDWFGFCTFFKSEFMHYKSEINFLEDFPFFNIDETNLFPVNEDQFASLSLNYQQILAEQKANSAYHNEIIRASFQAILWQIRRIYEDIKPKKKIETASVVIASKFQFLVNKNFIHNTSVEDYAEMLNVTPNHLSQTIKKARGRTAKSIITQRRFEESKFLLKHTNNQIAEICYHLNFLEPTHFNKFFKKESGYTPVEFRKIVK